MEPKEAFRKYHFHLILKIYVKLITRRHLYLNRITQSFPKLLLSKRPYQANCRGWFIANQVCNPAANREHSLLRDWLRNLATTTMVLQFMLEGSHHAQSFVLTFTLQLNIFKRNVPIRQLLQHISNSVVVCARSRSKILATPYKNELCQAS